MHITSMKNELDNLPTIPDNYQDYCDMFEEDTLNHKIFNLTAPYDNPYQGIRHRILFVCSAGLLRSPTGAHVGSTRGYNTRACGSSQKYALIPLTANLIEWAETIVFVNKENYDEAMRVFDDSSFDLSIKAKARILDIPDQYEAFHPTLVEHFTKWFDGFEAEQ